ncbi:hypothetical protein PIB30_061957 [Stylosanthes scabra]|uniref:Uncharacterized protein n=1 Tax=Stylosanthes scabra TaxID=79078 RepID=A0ABU6YIG8_9FABA|nr:hypothetical protein [Stylosanthes scabra]
MASWEDHENDSHDDDSDQEAQLCLMADSTEFNEENEAFKKENAQLNLQLNKTDSVLKIENEKLKNDLKHSVETTSLLASENQKLKTKISCLNNDLAKLTHSSNNLDELRAKQRPLFVKSGLGYVEKNKTVFRNDFEASTSKKVLPSLLSNQTTLESFP